MPETVKRQTAGAFGWLVALIGAFSASRELGWACVVGYACQALFNAPAFLKTWMAEGLAAILCVVFWSVVLGHNPIIAAPPGEGGLFGYQVAQEWWGPFGLWALGALGARDIAGRAGGPKTDSLG